MEGKFIEAVKEKLQLRGYKRTRPRLAILGYMAREKGHPDMQEIYDNILMECPGIGLATVYRTVELYLEMGVLRALTLRNNQLRYELNRPDDHHHHMVCTGCGQVSEFGSCNFQLIAGEIEKATRFRIYDHSLEVYGLCPICSEDKILSYSTEKM